MDKHERIASAIIRADFGGVIDRVKNNKEVIIVRRNNIDECAMVPLEYLDDPKTKKRKKNAA